MWHWFLKLCDRSLDGYWLGAYTTDSTSAPRWVDGDAMYFQISVYGDNSRGAGLMVDNEFRWRFVGFDDPEPRHFVCGPATRKPCFKHNQVRLAPPLALPWCS